MEQTVQRTRRPGEQDNHNYVERHRVKATKTPGPLGQALLGSPQGSRALRPEAQNFSKLDRARSVQ